MATTAVIPRPLPNIEDKLYQPFLRGLKERRLMVQRCEDCGHYQWPPREFCGKCHGESLSWTEVPQEGDVYTFSVVYRPFHPWFREHVPYALSVVDVGNGVRLLGATFGPEAENVTCGQHMRAEFEDMSEDIALLRWVPA